MKVLYQELDFVLRSVVSKRLEQNKFIVESIDQNVNIFDYNLEHYSVIILSINSINPEVYSKLKNIKKINVNCGLIYIVDHATIEEQVSLYENGADVVVAKPIDIELLIARILSTRRRVELSRVKRSLGDVSFNIPNQTISCNDTEEKLNPTEAKLMLLLADNYGKRIVSNEEITKLLYTIEGYNTKGAKVYVYRIRNKLKKIKSERLSIKNHYGNGYYLLIDDLQRETNE